MAYSYNNSKGQTYYLHRKDVTLKGSGHKQTIYFFSRNESGSLDELPQGYKVVENDRNNLPVLKKA